MPGTNARHAEKWLKMVFQPCQAWHAILPLNEADMFLAKRDSSNIIRNAFVTVFLYTMEYYQSITLLTTNRLEDSDDAFQSRIHRHIPCSAADSNRRRLIWKIPLKAQHVTHSLDDNALVRLGQSYPCSGREIKNIISMALKICNGQNKLISEDIIDAHYKLTSSCKHTNHISAGDS